MEMNKKEVLVEQHQDTELRLGLPGTKDSKCANNKRSFVDFKLQESTSTSQDCLTNNNTPPPKAQVIGWPPVRSYRKNCIEAIKKEAENGGMYVKVSMDGAPYLRKIDMKLYTCYAQLFNALQLMFKVQVGEYSKEEYVPTYEDKDGAPYLRKIDMKLYTCYAQLFNALQLMFKVQVGEYSKEEYVPTYEDKDGDWMLVGDVPWEMFITSCKRLRIMKGVDAKGLTC